MKYSFPTNNKPYDGWVDVMQLHQLGVTLHDAVTEKPTPGDIVIPIMYVPGDGDPFAHLPMSEWPWELPGICIFDTVIAEEYRAITEYGIVLWWISCSELSAAILRRVADSHLTSKAQYMAMRDMERKIGGSSNG